MPKRPTKKKPNPLVDDSKLRAAEQEPPVEAQADVDPERKALLLATGAALAARIKEARDDFKVFYELVWGAQVKDFHQQWLDALDDDESPRVLIEAPRDHGKTSVLCARVLWEISRNPSLRVRYVSQSDRRARDRLSFIKGIIERNPVYKMVFPKIKRGEEWSKSRIIVERPAGLGADNPTIEALGVFSTVVGGHEDLLVFDDPCDFRNSILYPNLRESLKQKFFSEWVLTLAPGGRIWIGCTPWSANDLYAVLKANDEWRLVSTPVGTATDPYVPIWPERWDRKKLQMQRVIVGAHEYSRAYRCVAISADTVVVRPEWIRYYDAELIGPIEKVANYIGVIAVDPALGESPDADFFAISFILYDPERNLSFVTNHTWHAHMSLAEQGAAVIQMHKRLHAQRIVIEKGAYQGALAQYLHEKSDVPLPIVLVSSQGKNKRRRLLEATPLIQDARVYFHPELNPQFNIQLAERGDMVSEILGLGQEPNDDLVDALVYGLQALQVFEEPKDDEDEDFERPKSPDEISTRVAVV